MDENSELLESFRSFVLVLAKFNIPKSLQSKIDPSDLVQCVMIKAIAANKKGILPSETSSLRAWLRTALGNEITDLLRYFGSQKRNLKKVEQDIHAGLETSHAGLVALLAADHTSPSTAAMRGEQLANLISAIDRLPEDVRDVLVMKHLQQMTLQEIERETGRTIPSIAGLLRRGLAQLREILEASH